MKTKITFLAVFLTLFLLSTAHALPLSLDGGSPGEIPGGSAKNDLLDPIYGSNDPRAGYYGATVMLDVDTNLTFTYRGKEAAYSNRFKVYYGGDWHELFDADAASVGDSRTLFLGAGVIPFKFDVYYIIIMMTVSAEVTMDQIPLMRTMVI